ncbi:hypothetical protein GN244_ATG00495 [Phytophthora infestans]|uniref:Uncharacterized protein n=1 Tax=Phytophthora infestans TaxID=4787 RepID=A0A833X2Q2_PHYIN|nr:hypothetical protein GN244_ATG00495 [Phytophthora infestans]
MQSVTVETDSRTIDHLRGYSNSEHGSANHRSVVVSTETVSSTIDNLCGDDSAQMATNVRENSLQQPVQSVSVETDGTTIDNLHINSNSKRGSAWSVVSKVTIEHLHGDGNSQTTVIATKNPFQRRLLDTVPIWLADYDPDGYDYISSGCEIPLYHMPSTVESLLANLQTIVDREDLRDMLRMNYRRFFIEMFFMKRFFYKGSRNYKPSDLWSLSQAWDAFMKNLRQIEASATRADGLVKWYAGFTKARSGFVMNTILGAQWILHNVSMVFMKCCAVIEQECPFCRPRGKKMTDEMRVSTNLLPSEMQVAINVLDDLIARE